LLTWIGGEQPLFQQEQPYYEYLRNRWSAVTGSATAWNTLLHDGVYTYTPPASGASYRDNLAALAGKITKPGSGSEITFYESVAIGAGQDANNPWLQEMPDPVNRCGWGNYLALPVTFDGTRKFIAHEKL